MDHYKTVSGLIALGYERTVTWVVIWNNRRYRIGSHAMARLQAIRCAQGKPGAWILPVVTFLEQPDESPWPAGEQSGHQTWDAEPPLKLPRSFEDAEYDRARAINDRRAVLVKKHAEKSLDAEEWKEFLAYQQDHRDMLERQYPLVSR